MLNTELFSGAVLRVFQNLMNPDITRTLGHKSEHKRQSVLAYAGCH